MPANQVVYLRERIRYKDRGCESTWWVGVGEVYGRRNVFLLRSIDNNGIGCFGKNRSTGFIIYAAESLGSRQRDMRTPHTVSQNVSEAYRDSLRTLSLPYQEDRSLRSEDESRDEGIIPDLKFLAIRVLVQRWEQNPILDTLPTPVDRDMVLEMLPTNLPFELTIKKIPDEIFWKRAAQDRWEYNYPYDHGNSWRRLYVERHLAEHLEQVEASYFEQQEATSSELIELCKNYVYTLRLRSLIPTKPSFEWSGEEEDDRCNADEDVVHHIPFHKILPRLPNLTESHVNFGMIYMNDGFDWRDFKFSIEDSKNLGRAIAQCEKLKTFRLTRSNLDHRRAAGLLQGIASNRSLLELDLSHCKLGDLGARAIGEFLTLTKCLKILHLANNYIGPSGVQGLVHGLLREGSAALTDLNLRLNPLSDEGGAHICSLLLRYAGLERLNVSGCGLTTASGIGMAECIASGYLKCTSLVLDLSNNDFGPIGENYGRQSFVVSSPLRVATASSDDHAQSKTDVEDSSDMSEEQQQNWQPEEISM